MAYQQGLRGDWHSGQRIDPRTTAARLATAAHPDAAPDDLDPSWWGIVWTALIGVGLIVLAVLS